MMALGISFPQTAHLPLFADKHNPTNTIKQPVGVSVLD